jgi:predicted nucleic acid-binding protein
LAVLDASAAVFALTRRDGDSFRTELTEYGELHCPHLIDIEYLSALRNLVRRDELTPDQAEVATLDFADLAITRFPHTKLLPRIWQLRQWITPYDATYVVLAELLEVPLITADLRLARAAKDLVEIKIFDA